MKFFGYFVKVGTSSFLRLFVELEGDFCGEMGVVEVHFAKGCFLVFGERVEHFEILFHGISGVQVGIFYLSIRSRDFVEYWEFFG